MNKAALLQPIDLVLHHTSACHEAFVGEHCAITERTKLLISCTVSPQLLLHEARAQNRCARAQPIWLLTSGKMWKLADYIELGHAINSAASTASMLTKTAQELATIAAPVSLSTSDVGTLKLSSGSGADAAKPPVLREPLPVAGAGPTACGGGVWGAGRTFGARVGTSAPAACMCKLSRLDILLCNAPM